MSTLCVRELKRENSEIHKTYILSKERYASMLQVRELNMQHSYINVPKGRSVCCVLES